MKAVVTIFSVLLLFCPLNALCEPIRGAGATSCGMWVEDRKLNGHYSQLAWIMGFISAYNHYVDSKARNRPDGVFGSIDHNAIAVWMDNYCSNNPLSSPYKLVVLRPTSRVQNRETLPEV